MIFPKMTNKTQITQVTRLIISDNKSHQDFDDVIIHIKKNNLKYTQYLLSTRLPIFINADLKYLINKIRGCKNSPEKSFTTKVGKHIRCEYSIFIIRAFDDKKLKMIIKGVKIV